MQHRPRKKTSFQLTSLIAVVVLMVILFISVGYFFVIPHLTDTGAQEKLLASLQANDELWQTNRPVSYRYVVERECDCALELMRPYVVTVARDLRTAQYLVTGSADSLGISEEPPEVVWLEELFAKTAEAVLHAKEVEVIFDPRFGYPSSVRINSSNRSTASFEVYGVRDFEVLEYE